VPLLGFALLLIIFRRRIATPGAARDLSLHRAGPIGHAAIGVVYGWQASDPFSSCSC
jgi:hypothetical protein